MVIQELATELGRSKVSIYIREKIASPLVEQIYGSFEGLVAEWESRASASRNFPRPRQRSSVYRWVKEGVPSRGDQIVALSALLDADPLCLFDYERNGYFRQFAAIRRKLQLGLAATGVLRPLFKVYMPGPHWPSNELIEVCYRRPWHGEEFDNAAHWRNRDYGLVRCAFRDVVDAPRAVHIAYRRVGSPDTMWRFYGTVLAIDGQLELYSESGAFQTMDQTQPNEIRFRTFFGDRHVEFRTASLHAFDVHTDVPMNDRSTIGFEW